MMRLSKKYIVYMNLLKYMFLKDIDNIIKLFDIKASIDFGKRLYDDNDDFVKSERSIGVHSVNDYINFLKDNFYSFESVIQGISITQFLENQRTNERCELSRTVIGNGLAGETAYVVTDKLKINLDENGIIIYLSHCIEETFI